MENKKIVILGGGFGGVACAKGLVKNLPEGWKIVLVDKNPYHTFYPALYEIATAYLDREPSTRFEFEELLQGASIPLSEIFCKEIQAKRLFLVEKEIQDIRIEEQEIVLGGGSLLPFDFLVFALGSETNYFGIPGLKELSLSLRGPHEAVNIRNTICEIFAAKKPNQRISIIIGGGGFTGCELAAELIHAIDKVAVQHPHWRDRVAMTVVEASEILLPGAKPWIQEETKKNLEKRGVSILFASPIASVKDSHVILKDGKELFFDLLLWTAGVRGNSLIERVAEITVQKGCKILVNNNLQIVPHETVFAIGDNLYCADVETGAPIPGTAQGAVAQGKITAKNIIRHIERKELLRYTFEWPIFVIPTGGKSALAEIWGLRVRGLAGWLLHQTAFLRYYMGILPFRRALQFWWGNVQMFSKND